jgi:hypothetical protein
VTDVIRHNRVRNWHNLGSVRDLTTPLSNAVSGSVVAAPVLLGAGDPGSTRLVYAMVVGLVVIGVFLILLGIWLFRQTRYDPPVLAPLERMGDKQWRRQSDPATQRRVLDEVRPVGAEPLSQESSPPGFDADFELHERPVTSMSDLSRPASSTNDLAPPIPESRSPTPKGIDRLDALGLEDDVVDAVEGSADAVDG